MFSLNKRLTSLLETIKVFPITSIVLWLLCILSLVLIRQDISFLTEKFYDLLNKLILVLLVYIFISTTITKRFAAERQKRYLLQSVLLMLAIWYFLILPDSFGASPTTVLITHGLIQTAAVVSLLIVPLWTWSRELQSTYHWLIQLIMHIVLAVIFSLVLSSWVSWALRWIEELFGGSIALEWYATVSTVSGILLWGLSFLDGIRKRNITDNEVLRSAKWKTMLGRVVWVLLIVYGCILYVYLAKVIITWVWPSNTVTPLSFAFSGFVVVWSIILVPLITDENDMFPRSKILLRMYLSLLPIIAMVWCAISLRIQQYWLTEMRYIICMILVRLWVSAWYCIVSNRKDLWYIPVFFVALVVVSFVGWPFSASWMARWYQTWILDDFIENNALVTEGVIDATRIAELSNQDKEELSELLRYLVDYHGVESIQQRYSQEAENSYEVLSALWLSEYNRYGYTDTVYRYYGVSSELWSVSVEWYNSLYSNIRVHTFKDRNEIWIAYMQWKNLILSVEDKERNISFDDIMKNFETIEPATDIPQDQLTYVWSWIKIVFNEISWEESQWVFTVTSAEFSLLVE